MLSWQYQELGFCPLPLPGPAGITSADRWHPEISRVLPRRVISVANIPDFFWPPQVITNVPGVVFIPTGVTDPRFSARRASWVYPSLFFHPFPITTTPTANLLVPTPTNLPRFTRVFSRAVYTQVIDQNTFPILGPKVAGNYIGVITAIYAHTSAPYVLMPAAIITRVVRYNASIRPNSGQEASNQPVYNQ